MQEISARYITSKGREGPLCILMGPLLKGRQNMGTSTMIDMPFFATSPHFFMRVIDKKLKEKEYLDSIR